MTIHIIIVSLIVLIFTIGIIYLTTYNKYQDYIIRINEVESKIDDYLRDKVQSYPLLHIFSPEMIMGTTVLKSYLFVIL